MTVLLIAKVRQSEVSALDALTRQLCRWKIKGDAELVFLAEDTTTKVEQKTSTVCIQFKNLGDSKAFASELKEVNRELVTVVSIDFLRKLHTPNIDALGVLV